MVVDRKTQLENQLLGAFPRLDRTLILASAFRDAKQRAQRTLTPLQRRAVRALMNREFNRDDIDRLKSHGIVGEARDGLLAVVREDALTERDRNIVDEENRDRLTVMRHVVLTHPDLDPSDLPLVRSVFYRLNAQASSPGVLVQQADGRFVAKRGARKPSATARR